MQAGYDIKYPDAKKERTQALSKAIMEPECSDLLVILSLRSEGYTIRHGQLSIIALLGNSFQCQVP